MEGLDSLKTRCARPVLLCPMRFGIELTLKSTELPAQGADGFFLLALPRASSLSNFSGRVRLEAASTRLDSLCDLPI